MDKRVRKILHSSWLPVTLALVGWLFFFYQAWIYAHIQTSFLDEGGFLYIGSLYARGIARPFQDYGPLRLYAPLSYLIPGQIEAWFGASLRTGRYFSIFCGLVMIAAIWFTSKRLAGMWWAAAAVWAIAISPISSQIYSLAISESLVACILSLSLMFTLGSKRRLWQIITGAILAGLAVMTRQNLVMLIPLGIAYVFWESGKKAGFWFTAGCLLPILVLHIIYWPNILEIWAVWLPARLTPFLNPFRLVQVNFVGAPPVSLANRLQSLAQGIRFHYFTIVGFCVCLFLWPSHNKWKNQTSKRIAYFLASLFLVLAFLHAWASFLLQAPAVSCTYCFTPYLAFFDIVVYLLIIVTIPSWKYKISTFVNIVITLFILILSATLGYGTFEKLGPWVLNIKFPAITRGWDPHQWTPFITLWDILSNKYQQDYWSSRVVVATIAGITTGVLILFIGKLLHKKMASSYSYGAFILPVVLAAGTLLSPLMGGTYRQEGICKADILESYEQVGKTLRETIPENSRVYWGNNNAVALLYAPDIRIPFPQIYALSYFRSDGDSDQLLKHGFWNADLARQWIMDADYVVAESMWPQRADYPPDIRMPDNNLVQTPLANPCDPLSYLNIFRIKP
jgi:hypothetical protein